AVLLDDVDVERIADRLFWAAFRNCGQICMAVKRVYVPARLHADVVEALAERATSVTVGPGLAPGTRLGPVNNAPQLARVAHLVRQAPADRAPAASGGHRPPRARHFLAPTLSPRLPPHRPVVTVQPFRAAPP